MVEASRLEALVLVQVALVQVSMEALVQVLKALVLVVQGASVQVSMVQVLNALVQVSLDALVLVIEHEQRLRRNFVPELAAMLTGAVLVNRVEMEMQVKSQY